MLYFLFEILHFSVVFAKDFVLFMQLVFKIVGLFSVINFGKTKLPSQRIQWPLEFLKRAYLLLSNGASRLLQLQPI